MKRINILDQHTSNKIAAGEVVERPSSVVKELIENSIDANAKNITIEIEDGGASLIRIIDDGDGIHKDDIAKAFLPHATSKIKSVEDIYTISSLGFRGEALPSIASVGMVNLKSKPENEDFGGEITIEGGEVLDTKEVGMNKGTIMEVRNLFFNIPARKKFLKTSSREGSLINDIVTRIALSNPNISFKYYNSGKKVLHTYGNGILKDVIRTVYGKIISDNLIHFESDGDVISIRGYIGKEEVARGSRNNQSIFVNGRYIKNRTLVVAVENAFKSFATVNKFPFFVLFVDVYPEFVDVNIHPTKEEIKFKEDRAVFKKVFDSVHSAFKEEVFNSFQVPEENSNEYDINAEVVENISFEINYKEPLYNYEKAEVDLRTQVNLENKDDKVPIKDSSLDINLNDIEKEEALYSRLKALSGDGKLKSQSLEPPLSTSTYNKENLANEDKNTNDYLKESNNCSDNSYKTITQWSESNIDSKNYDFSDNHATSSTNRNDFDTNNLNLESQHCDLNTKSQYCDLNDNNTNTSNSNHPHVNLNSTNEHKTSNISSEKVEFNKISPKFPKLRIIGQFNKTYILAEYEEVLYLIDQHAAHEKILFEKYLKEIEEGSIIIQPLLLPALIDLTIDDYCSYEENLEVFKSSGFNIESFGGNTVAIKEVPYFLGKLNPKSLFMSILDNLKNLGSGKTTEVKYNRISTMACKAAVKANDNLEIIEMEKLIDDLRYIEDPFHCPHGRPVIIKFTSYELDKKFRRIV